MLVLEQLTDKFTQFTFSNKPLLILLVIVVTNVSFLKEIWNLEFIYLTILPQQRVAPITLGLP